MKLVCSSYTDKKIERLKEMEAFHFWSVARRKLILNCLKKYSPGKKILDVGCGSGSLLFFLKQNGYLAEGVDSHAAAPIQASAEKLPFLEGEFDALILADVLEHIEEKKALEEAFRVLTPKGILLLSVPAFSWLWSRRDVEAGHLRRYNAKEIFQIASVFNAKILFFSYYQFFLFPLFFLSRFFNTDPKREELISPWINACLLWVNSFEIWLGKWIRWPFGSSMIVVMQKNGR